MPVGAADGVFWGCPLCSLAVERQPHLIGLQQLGRIIPDVANAFADLEGLYFVGWMRWYSRGGTPNLFRVIDLAQRTGRRTSIDSSHEVIFRSLS